MAAQHVAVSISPDARDRVRALAFALTGETGRRITMSDAIEAACSLAAQRLDWTLELLPAREDEQ